MGRYPVFLFFAVLCLLLDWYVYQGAQVLTDSLQPGVQLDIYNAYWGFSILVTGTILLSSLLGIGERKGVFKRVFLPLFFLNYAAKLFAAFFLFLDDITRGVRWGWQLAAVGTASTTIARSTLLTKVAMLSGIVPLLIMGYGIIAGAHAYKVHRVKVKLPHLPSAFHGLRIGQLSDIHCGSFVDKEAIRVGVDLLRRENPDLIFFTGDLVNDTADEVTDYLDVFDQVQAPLGVYSVLGNHDYGDYVDWPSAEEKEDNLQALCAAHRQLGWHLLRNEHAIITRGDDQLAIIGVENWGTGAFSKYGRLDQAYRGTEAVPVKLLLSHDPSHWDAQVKPNYPDIDVTFSGHTHGFQLGIELGRLKWSPVQYRYKQWAGLYQAGAQFLYVNRGYGYLGYPGRVGMWPEITIMELEKA